MTTLVPRLSAQARLRGENERRVVRRGEILLRAVFQLETLQTAPVLPDEFTRPGALVPPQQSHTSHLTSLVQLSPGVLPDGEAQLE